MTFKPPLRNFLLALFATALLLETLSAAALRWRDGLGYGSFRSAKDLVAAEVDPSTGQATGAELWRGRESQVHPYFGYVMVPGSKPWLNNAGFPGESDYPYVPKRGELVVGVFGGSVAHGLYFWLKRNEEAVANRFLRLAWSKGFDRVTFLCFANGGYLQPISTNVLLYYMSSVDVALFVEGFNELQISAFNQRADGYPADFPYRGFWETLANDSVPPAALRVIASLNQQRERLALATDLARLPILRHSAFVHLTWQAYGTHVEKATNRLRTKLDEVQQLDLQTRYNGALTGSSASEADKVFAFLDKYRSYLHSADAAARANGVVPIFVLQPSQYLPGAKPLSPLELSERTTNRRFAHLVESYYPRFVEMFDDLKRDGLLAMNMTEVFSDTEETMYSDACCHLENRGNALLMEAILDKLSTSEEFRTRLPTAGAPILSAGGG